MDIDASDSSSAYQDGALVQQEAIQYPYYIQVANEVKEELPAIREYKENNPFFFGKSMYSDVAPDNASWLASNGQYNARSIYPDCYDWLLAHIGETITANGGKVVLSTDTFTDYDWVVNTGDETFRLPLLDGSESLPGDARESLVLDTNTGVHSIVKAKNGFYNILINSSTAVSFVCETGNNYESAFSDSSRTTRTSLFALANQEFLYAWSGDTTNLTASSNIFFVPAVGNGILYYYVGDTVQDASLINAGAVLEQLANKADINAGNFSEIGKSYLSGLSMPSDRYIDLTLGASGSTYTAPANGYVALKKEATAGGQAVLIESSNKISSRSVSTATGQEPSVTIPVFRGDSFTVTYGAGGATRYFKFIYSKGEN
ncbi:MAG: hypothetical protein IJ564_07265 [Alphaproteobacteria bacterium]|nr:hypothetical protein [Alphaproteobacteria bacterium]